MSIEQPPIIEDANQKNKANFVSGKALAPEWYHEVTTKDTSSGQSIVIDSMKLRPLENVPLNKRSIENFFRNTPDLIKKVPDLDSANKILNALVLIEQCWKINPSMIQNTIDMQNAIIQIAGQKSLINPMLTIALNSLAGSL